MEIFNIHIHTFTDKDVPRKFLPLQLVRILSSKVGYAVLSKALNFLNPLSTKNQFKKYLKFASTGKLKSQKEILKKCMVQYPSKTRFVIHPMDMSCMNAGGVPRDYIDQLIELKSLSLEFDNTAIPFVHVEPNNIHYRFIFNWAMQTGAFKGIKIYPPASCHLPTDSRLKPIYEYCNKNMIPILAHCGAESPTHYHDTKKNIREKLDAVGLKWNKKMDKAELCGQFTHPANYIPILEKYPNINICLAHWGSENCWQEYLDNPENKDNWFYVIKDMIIKYPNLYTDISFTLNNQHFFSVLKVFLQDKRVSGKVIFGTDFYMVVTKVTEKKFCFDLRAYLGEDLFKQIACINPMNYLKIKN